ARDRGARAVRLLRRTGRGALRQGLSHPAVVPDLRLLPAVRGASGERLQRALRGVRRRVGCERELWSPREGRGGRTGADCGRGCRPPRATSRPGPGPRHRPAGASVPQGPPAERRRAPSRPPVTATRVAPPAMRSRQAPSIAGSPILIGTVTVLVTVVAVFLAYNANSGLPFVPTYRVTAEVPNAASLVDGNEVRAGGKRVGVLDRIVAETSGPRTYAKLSLKLDKAIQPIRDDSQVTVRPRSPLGLKYLELIPGKHGRPIRDGGTLALARARDTVELDQVL